jgi:single-stranded-DNA-specific exonuclease
MSIGIRGLITDSPAEAEALATRLDELNKERRVIEGRMQEEAIAAVRHLKDPDDDGYRSAPDGRASSGSRVRRRHGLCLYDPGWHQGVVGLVAGRLKDRMRRPVIAFADAGAEELRGSARSPGCTSGMCSMPSPRVIRDCSAGSAAMRWRRG